MRKNLMLTGIVVSALLILLAACGANKNEDVDEILDLDNAETENIVENVDDTENSASSLDTEIVELYSDDHKMVFKNLNNSSLVFYYEGDKITGHEIYLEAGDAAAAKFAAAQVERDDTIKDVYAKGKYVVVVYNESEYEDLTTSNVKLAYSYLEEIQKGN